MAEQEKKQYRVYVERVKKMYFDVEAVDIKSAKKETIDRLNLRGAEYATKVENGIEEIIKEVTEI